MEFFRIADELNKIKDDLLKKAAKGALIVEDHDDQELADTRYKTCLSCENFDSVEKKCKICKCYMEVKVWSLVHRNIKKMRDEITHCPNGYWNDADIANKYRLIDGKELI